jgi:hypothetical protein
MLEDALSEGGFVLEVLSSAEDPSVARQRDPALPVVYRPGRPRGLTRFCVPNRILVAKPFAPPQLVTAVAQLLTPAGRRPSWPVGRMGTFRLLPDRANLVTRQANDDDHSQNWKTRSSRRAGTVG